MKNGLTIQDDWDTVDQIMEQNLLHSYCSLKEDIKRLKSKKKLQDWEKEDLDQFERLVEAMDVIGAYFVYDFDKKAKKYAKQQL